MSVDRDKRKAYEIRMRAFQLAAYGIAHAPNPEYVDIDPRVLLWLATEMDDARKAAVEKPPEAKP